MILYTASVKIQTKDKTNYKHRSLQLGLITPNESKLRRIGETFYLENDGPQVIIPSHMNSLFFKDKASQNNERTLCI